MQPYSDAELECLLADLESDLVERKETFKGDAPKKVRQAVCAFANDLPNHGRPGVVFIGARDDGSPTGLQVTDELLCQLADIKSDGQIVPPPTLTVARCTLRGSQMAVLTVWPADSPPVRYKGRIYIRTGPRRDIASAQDERILNEKRRHRDRPYDVRPVAGATWDDLDLVRFETEYLRAAVDPEVLAANDRTREQRLAATKMIAGADDPCPTVLGLLVIGKDPLHFLPGAYVQFLRVQGSNLTDPVVDAARLDGPVADLLRRLDDKLATHNRTRVDFTSGSREQRRDLYPPVALQQLTRNAVMHRTYEGTHAPARVYWYDDRIEIISPGGPYGEVTLQNFGTPGITDYRNPNLAEALQVLGFVQKFGVGIAAAKHAMKQNGNPPIVFEVTPEHVLAVLKPAP